MKQPQPFSQRDDLYGIIQTFLTHFDGYFMNVVYDSFKYELFDKFNQETYSKMLFINEDPDLTVEI